MKTTYLDSTAAVARLKSQLPALPSGRSVPTLVIVMIEPQQASIRYVERKAAAAPNYGVQVETLNWPATTTDDVRAKMEALALDPAYHGIILQLPIPPQLDESRIVGAIPEHKDVDNLTGRSPYVSPVVQAVNLLVQEYDLRLRDRRLVIVGHGRLVGKPLEVWFSKNGLNPTVVTELDVNADDLIFHADVVITACGLKGRIHADNAPKGAEKIIVNCGVPGEVDVNALDGEVGYMTPNFGGIGPATVHFLLMNTRDAFAAQAGG